MYKLDEKYTSKLEQISEQIQSSEELNQYLESEEEEDYKGLQDTFEPLIAQVHEEVVNDAPLQLIELENMLLAPSFEGLYIPRILGYSVLRGEINSEIKYARPQMHFRDVLRAIVHSANFEMIKKRIGQSVQMGFALSSDIWVTNLIAEVNNKRIKAYLENLVPTRFRDEDIRKGALNRYARQFSNMEFLTAKIPTTKAQLENSANTLIRFLSSRDQAGLSHGSYEKALEDLLNNEELQSGVEFVKVLMAIMRAPSFSDHIKNTATMTLNRLRKTMPRFNDIYFELLRERLTIEHKVDINLDREMIQVLDASIDDDLVDFYHLMDTMHSKGYIHDDTVEEVRRFYNNYEGLSTINDALRWTVSGYFNKLLSHLEEEDYPEYFEMSNIFNIYVNLFSNEAFNQRVKQSNLAYVKRVLAKFKDKRSREYQEVKKFVSTAFVDMGFFTEKEVVELFKTKRKKRTVK